MLPTTPARGGSNGRCLGSGRAPRMHALVTQFRVSVPAVSVAAGPRPSASPPGRGPGKATTSALSPTGRVSWRNPPPARRSLRSITTRAAADPDAPPGSLPALRAALDAAVAREDYAEAARIRDRLR